MKNLFVFGCSFTHGNGCLPHDIYNIEYKESREDMIWPDILKTHYNLTLRNISCGGESNDKILDRIIGAFDTINEGDMVIIQMTYHHRFDIPNKENNVLKTIAPSSSHILSPEFSDEEISHLNYVASIYESELYKKRNTKRFEFVKNSLIQIKKVKTCVLWNLYPDYYGKYETIRDATRDKINDLHWSYKGHRDFANNMIKIIENDEKNNN